MTRLKQATFFLSSIARNGRTATSAIRPIRQDGRNAFAAAIKSLGELGSSDCITHEVTLFTPILRGMRATSRVLMNVAFCGLALLLAVPCGATSVHDDASPASLYRTSDLAPVNSAFLDTAGRSRLVTANLTLAVGNSRIDQEEVLHEIHLRRPQLDDAINTVLVGFDLKSFISPAAESRQIIVEAFRDSAVYAINSRMRNKIDTVLIRDLIVYDATPVSIIDSRIIVVPRGREIADLPPMTIWNYFPDVFIGPAFLWILAYFASLIFVASMKDIFFIFAHPTGPSRRGLRQYAADASILVGILLSVMEMIYILSHLGTEGLQDLLFQTAGALSAFVCGLLVSLLIRPRVIVEYAPDEPSDELFPEKSISRGIGAFGIVCVVLYFLGIGIEVYVNWPAALVLLAPIATNRIFKSLPDSSRIPLTERARLVIGYVILIAGSMNAAAYALVPKPVMENIGYGVAAAFVSVVFMTAGTLLKRTCRSYSVVRFPSAWIYVFAPIILVHLIVIIALAARTAER